MNNIGDRIRAARIKCGITQEKLANAIGVKKSTISKYERNQREPDLGTILKICEHTNTTLDYLLGIVDEHGWLTGEGFADPEDFEIIKLLGYDNPETRARLLANTPEVKPEDRIAAALEKLSAEGKEVAVERVEELTEIPKYQKKPPQD